MTSYNKPKTIKNESKKEKNWKKNEIQIWGCDKSFINRISLWRWILLFPLFNPDFWINFKATLIIYYLGFILFILIKEKRKKERNQTFSPVLRCFPNLTSAKDPLPKTCSTR